MKSFTTSTLTIVVAMLSFSMMIQSDPNPFRANHHNQKSKSNITLFTPDNSFGGVDAQGKYKKRGKTATIVYDQATYSFNKIVENPNPILHKNKLDLVTLGFFSDHTNSKEMPVTTYIFGSPTNDVTRKVIQTLKKAPESTQEDQSDSDNEYGIENAKTIDSLSFKPSKQFAGHDLVGTYVINTHEATINDPSGKNKKSYVFENVQEGLPISLTSNNVRPLQKPILIGTCSSIPQCSNGTPQVCSNAIKHTNLYGNLKQ